MKSITVPVILYALADPVRLAIVHALAHESQELSCVDMMNRTTSPAPVSLKQGAMQVNNIEIEAHSTEITFAVTTSIAPEVPSQVGNVYPNPTTSIAALDLTLERAADLRVEVVSVLGTRMWSSETKLAAGKHTLPVNLEDMPAGVYMVRVLNEGSAVAIRRVVKD